MNSDKGFSLIELILVIAVMGIIGAIVMPNFAKIGQKAKETALKSSAHTLQVGLESYFLQTGHYPEGNLDIEALTTALRGEEAIHTAIINPFTGNAATAADASGRISYQSATGSSHYVITVMGEGNASTVTTIEN